MARPVNAAGVALIKSFESCRLSSYPDPGTGGAPWTIGWGHTGPEVVPGLTWTQGQADSVLTNDLNAFASQVEALINDDNTSDNQFAALVSFAYNVGVYNLKSSTLLQMHNAQNFDGAYAQFGRWIHANGDILPGLITRRAAEANLYNTD